MNGKYTMINLVVPEKLRDAAGRFASNVRLGGVVNSQSISQIATTELVEFEGVSSVFGWYIYVF
jgi:cytochrome c-type biogenesis protein CcmE